MQSYDTLSQAVSGLKQRGFTTDFNLENDCIRSTVPELSLKPAEFEITEVYRFEGDSDPADESVVYAIESKHGVKGILVNGFGTSADAQSDELISKLKISHEEN